MLVGIEMELLCLDINIAREDIIHNYVLDEGTLVGLLVIKILDVRERYGKHFGEDLSHLVLALNEDEIFGLDSVAYGAIGVSSLAIRLKRRNEKHAVAHTGSGLSDLYELGTRDNDTVLIDDSDNAVYAILHLMNYALKQSVGHPKKPILSANMQYQILLIAFLYILYYILHQNL